MTDTTTAAAPLKVPGATLHYEVRGTGPLLLLVGAPMDADAFAPLAELLATDHTVVTTDPRGIKRSVLDDPEQDSTPELRAADLAALIAHVDAGPATVFGSSGGAVTALALAQLHPEHVHTVIAHEPPLAELLADREQARADTDELIATYRGGDRMAAWRKFMAIAAIHMPDGVLEMMFGSPDEQQLADERRWFLHELRQSTHWIADTDALRAGPVRVVVGIGEDSAGQLCDRTSSTLAAALGVEPTRFPGGHTGFAEDPAGFAPHLRAVLPA